MVKIKIKRNGHLQMINLVISCYDDVLSWYYLNNIKFYYEYEFLLIVQYFDVHVYLD